MTEAVLEKLCAALHEIGVEPAFVERASKLGLDQDAISDWIDLAADLREMRQRHGALLVYEASERVFPGDRYLWNNRGVLLRSWDRYQEALRCFTRASEIDPTYARAVEGRAECLKLLRDYRAAAEAYRALFLLSEGSPQAWNNHAQCLRELGEIQEAIAAFRRSLALDPHYTEAWFNLAACANAAKEFDTALEAVEALLKLNPQDAEALRLRDEISRRPDRPTPIEQPTPQRIVQVVRHGRRATGIEELRALIDRGLETIEPPQALPPKAFISYRWGTSEEDAWVERLAHDLQARGYDTVFDREVQAGRTTPLPVTELVAMILSCNWFVPVLTEPYRRRVDLRAGAATVIEDGWVFDEYQAALRLGELGRLTFKGVWRSGPVVPMPFRRENVCDFREDAGYQIELERAFPRCLATITGVRSNGTARMVGPIERARVQSVGRGLESTGEFDHFVIAYHWESDSRGVSPPPPGARG